jgi:hypothetical protein
MKLKREKEHGHDVAEASFQFSTTRIVYHTVSRKQARLAINSVIATFVFMGRENR